MLVIQTLDKYEAAHVKVISKKRMADRLHQVAHSPGFYIDYQYERAHKFLEWMTNIIHTNDNYRNVGMLEIVNEPEQSQDSDTDSMRQQYYPTAWQRIRAAEDALQVAGQNRLHVQMMVWHRRCQKERSSLTVTGRQLGLRRPRSISDK